MKKRKLNLTNYGHVLGITSASLLTFIALALLCPAIRKDIYATDTATTQAEVIVQPVISVGVQSKVSMDITPKLAGQFASSEATIAVDTNSLNGYALYMSTLYGPNLVSSDTANQAVIQPVAEGTTVDSFTTNSWGYSLDTSDNKTYSPVPTEANVAVKKTDDATLHDELTLTFGAAIDTNMPAGNYTNTVTIAAVANPITISSLSQLTYMQHMTSEICANTAYDVNGNMDPETADLHNPVTKQLIDTRDGKKYWVAKLADGNCWMTQNLALDITTEGLKASDTDIELDWTARDKYPPTETNAIKVETIGTGKYQTTYSWNLGEYIEALPLQGNACANFNDIAKMDDICKNANIFDVSSNLWTPTFTAKQGTYVMSNGTTYNGLVAVQPNNYNDLSQGGEYDPHYLIGNYYQWNTATAGTGDTTAANQNAPDSVCPKNWRLPSANHTVGFDTDGSFAYLLRQYGLATSSTSGKLEANGYNAVSAPLYFIKAGEVAPYYGYFQQIGAQGTFWSSTSIGGPGYSGAQYLYLYIAQLSPAFHGNHGPDYREYGFAVRCLAR